MVISTDTLPLLRAARVMVVVALMLVCAALVADVAGIPIVADFVMVIVIIELAGRAFSLTDKITAITIYRPEDR